MASRTGERTWMKNAFFHSWSSWNINSLITRKGWRDVQTTSSFGTYKPAPLYDGGFVSTCDRRIEGGRPNDKLYDPSIRSLIRRREKEARGDKNYSPSDSQGSAVPRRPLSAFHPLPGCLSSESCRGLSKRVTGGRSKSEFMITHEVQAGKDIKYMR